MLTPLIEIIPYTEKLKPQLVAVWEKSVLVTHDFLSPVDFNEIKESVKGINFYDLQVYCLMSKNQVLGFVGVYENKVEMLFLDPQYMGQGHGYRLLTLAVKELNADKVDVNEQNTSALKFYQRFGFNTFERTDKDDQGRNYPLLRMKLIPKNQ